MAKEMQSRGETSVNKKFFCMLQQNIGVAGFFSCVDEEKKTA